MTRDPLAIVGLSALLPGAADADAFWRRLIEGWDAIVPATAEDFGLDPAAIFDPERGVPDRICNLYGAWLRGVEVDCEGYAVPAAELARHGPLVRWPLHLAHTALAQADATVPLDRDRCGLLLGAYSWGTTQHSTALLRTLYDPLIEPALAAATGRPGLRFTDRCEEGMPENALIAGYVPGLLCRALSLKGPRYAVDAACATSLYALKLAALHLWAGQADTMVVTAASTIDPVYATLGFAALHALPAGSRSRPLDAASEGLALGQGGVAFVVRRLADARADGQPVRAIIRGIGLSSDGRGQHLITPNPKGQRLACERAYEEAGLAPSTIDYIECHATGTRVGDRSELGVLSEVFGDSGTVPLLGSVKSNLGHLLTAAGGVGLLKTVLAMAQGTIPPTIAIRTPLSSDDGRLGADRIVREPRPWPGSQPGMGAARRRAAVNAFGFGGTNAHLILEDAGAGPNEGGGMFLPAEPLAIVGMGMQAGTVDSLEAWRQRLPEGVADARPLPPRRWSGLDARVAVPPAGAWIDDLTLDALHYRLPPRELERLNPQQTLMLAVADAALRDAGIAEGSRVAVVIAAEAELSVHRLRARWDSEARLDAALAAGGQLPAASRHPLAAALRDALHPQSEPGDFLGYIGNLLASRITVLWDFPAPNFTISAQENGGLQALVLADLLLRAGEADAVLVGAVDLAGGPETVWLRSLLAGPAAAPGFALGPDGGWWPGEGAGAVVVQRADAARAAGRAAYALIDAVAAAPLDGDPAAAIGHTVREALATAGAEAGDIGLIEVFAGGDPAQDAQELAGLAGVYGVGVDPCALGSAKAQIGHTGAASGLLGVIRAALCLSDKLLPGQPGWMGPHKALPTDVGRLVVGGAARPWLRGRGRRRAAVQGLGLDARSVHVLLSEGDRAPLPRLGLSSTPPLPLPVFAADLDGLLTGLDAFAGDARPLAQIARERLLAAPTDGLALVLVARDRDELAREIALARKTLSTDVAKGRDWQTPAGSQCSPRPLGPAGKVAFVYPGIGSAGPGLGSELFALAPEALAEIEAAFANPAQALSADLIYPTAFGRVGPAELEAADEALLADGLSALKTTLIFAVGYARLLSARLGLTPDLACGHSMGELSMLVAGGVWQLSEDWLQAVVASDSVTQRLGGAKHAVRAAWGLSDDAPLDWSSLVLTAAPEAVRAALAGESQVYLTHVNAPGETVIAGDESACQRVAARLGVDALRSTGAMAIHCPPVESERDPLQALLERPVFAAGAPRYLFSAGFSAGPGESITAPAAPKDLAALVVDGIARAVDFPAIVEQLYAEGARYFIEVGAGATCTRWVGATLGGRAHLALPVNRRGASDSTTLTRLLAALLAHRAPIDPARWAALLPEPPAPARMPIRVELGGASIPDALARLPRVQMAASPGTTGLPPVAGQRPAIVAAAADPELPPWDHRFVTGSRAAPGHRRGVDRSEASPGITELHSVAGQSPAIGPAKPVHRADDGAASECHQTAGLQPATGYKPVIPGEGCPAVAVESSAAAAIVELAIQTAQAHAAFLAQRRSAVADIAALAGLGEPASASGLASVPARDYQSVFASGSEAVSTRVSEPPPSIVFDESDILAFAQGRLSTVLGPDYTAIDALPRRIRVPAPPFMALSRVTAIDYRKGRLGPASISTEYDVPDPAWHAVDGLAPYLAMDAQGVLVLLSCLGLDERLGGVRGFRWLDASLTFLGDRPRAGQRVSYDIRIDRFVEHGDTLLFFSDYMGRVDGRPMLRIDDCCAGFFSAAELAEGQGLADAGRPPRPPPADRLASRCSEVAADALLALTRGEIAAVFGRAPASAALRLPPPAMLMIDRITQLAPNGGRHGRGLVIAEKDLDPTHWYIQTHFLDDPVFAGPCMIEGGMQMLQIFALACGLGEDIADATFQPLTGLPLKVKFRGQVPGTHSVFTYRLEVVERGVAPQPYLIADIDLIHEGKVRGRLSGLSVQVVARHA